ncbi:MAG: hypothetical protein RR209_00690 [Angelakisella sp.]
MAIINRFPSGGGVKITKLPVQALNNKEWTSGIFYGDISGYSGSLNGKEIIFCPTYIGLDCEDTASLKNSMVRATGGGREWHFNIGILSVTVDSSTSVTVTTSPLDIFGFRAHDLVGISGYFIIIG